MLRKVRKIVFGFLLSLLLLILVIVLTINLPFNFFRKETSDLDYSNWMGDSLQSDQLVIDIAMLGAHDAFTADIGLTSPTDPLSAAGIQTGFTGALIKGFSVKQAKTQVSDAETLLKAGVRYFDIRLSYLEKEEAWYTSHGIFSSPFIDTLIQIESFLEEHPGEFLILDIQHVYLGDKTEEEAFTEIKTLFETSGIYDRAYPEGIKSLSAIRYDDMTSLGNGAGVLVFTKLTTADPAFWSYGASIRSAWANTDSYEEAFAFLEDEVMKIAGGTALTGNQMSNNPEAVDAREGLRVMQGVLTMQMSGDGIVNALLEWSLLSRAREFNATLIEQEDFDSWLPSMPIVMVDYADTNYKDFLDQIMLIVIDYNQK